MAVDGFFGDAAEFGEGHDRKAPEIDHFDEFGEIGVVLFELFKGAVHVEDFVEARHLGQEEIVEGDALVGLGAFVGAGEADVVDEPAAQEAGGDAVEVEAVLPIDVADADEFEEDFVGEGGGLEAVGGGAALHGGFCHVDEAFVDGVGEISFGAGVSVLQAMKIQSYGARLRRHVNPYSTTG